MRLLEQIKVWTLLGFLLVVCGSARAQTQTSTSSEGTETAPPASTGLSSEIKIDVEKWTLPNGLTVLFQEDHSAPLISYQTWFRVGSKNEEPGSTGLAHLFEHMMFKGSTRHSGEEFDKLLQGIGATNNAGTTHDYTFYYENLPAGHLELAVDLESDRMQGLQITDANLKTELSVVKEERGYRVDSSPIGVLIEVLYATVFKVSHYRWPVVGYTRDLDQVTPAKAQAFYKKFYAPNNAIVIVAGDFSSADAKALITKYYSPISRSEIPNQSNPSDPVQTDGRIQVVEKNLQAAIFASAFHAPKDGTPDAYALDLLAFILGHGPSSRLYKRMVYKEQNVAMVEAENETLKDAGVFQVIVQMKPKADWRKAQKAVLGELWRLRNQSVSDEELEGAKNQIIKSIVDSLKTVHGRGEALGINEVFHNDYSEAFKALDRYMAVSKDDIRKAAGKFLQPNSCSTILLKPSNAKSQKSRE